MTVKLTKEQMQLAVPRSLKGAVTDSMIDHVNNVIIDHPYAEHFRDNILGYISVLQEGKFKVTDYLNAVQYVSHKMLNATNIAAFTKTFPDKISKWQSEGVASKDIASYVSAYNKTKLVQLILEQSITPVWLLNMDHFQEAINTQVELMRTAKSEKVRSDAATSIMTHLKRPDTAKIDIKVSNPAAESAISALEATTAALIEQQKLMIKERFNTAQEIAHLRMSEKVIDHDNT